MQATAATLAIKTTPPLTIHVAPLTIHVAPLTIHVAPRVQVAPAKPAYALDEATFAKMGGGAKAGYAVVRAVKLVPTVLGQLWSHKGEVLGGFVAPYLHPIRSLHEANAAVAAAAAEGPVETMLAALKYHGGLAAAWLLPIGLALAPFTGFATVLAAASGYIGIAALAAMGLSLGKNVIDAARAQSVKDLDKQSDQILQDGVGLGFAAGTVVATKLGSRMIDFVRARFGPGKAVPGTPLAPKELTPAESRAQRMQALVGPSDAEIAGMKLVPTKHGQTMRGNSVKLIVQDAQTGQKFVFKPIEASATTIETEQFAMAMRRAAGEPTYQAIPQQVTLADGTVLQGYVKPFVKNDGMLGSDPLKWSRTQHENVLADHVWGEFLGNYDTKPDQSVLIGKNALNLDWDRSLLDYMRRTRLTRFKSDNPAPPAANLMYQEYVAGRIDLDFKAMFETVKRVRGLSDDQVRAAIQPFLDKAFVGGKPVAHYATPEALVETVLARKKYLDNNFGAFVKTIRHERQFNLGLRATPPTWATYVTTSWNDRFMKSVGVLMDTPLFTAGNRFIQLATGWRQRILGLFGMKPA